MSEHLASVKWERGSHDEFKYETYDRGHTIRFEGGLTLKSSAAKEFLGKAELSNPEEQLVGALASCHMLTFLAICARSRITVDSYDDRAVGILDKNANGKLSVTKITLKPRTKFSGATIPDAAKLKELHDKAHANCFIANSIQCSVDMDLG